MASFVKYYEFVQELGLEGHLLTTDQVNVALTNTAPTLTHTTLAQVTEITAANGYVADGEDTANGWTNTTGTSTCAASDVTWTASGGAINTFQYVILFNVTAGDKLIGYWDYGSAVDLAVGESFTVDFTTSSFTLA